MNTSKKPVTLEFLYEEIKANAENTTFLLQQIIKEQGKVGTLETRFDTLETRFDSLETRFDIVVHEVVSVKEEVKEIAERLTRVEKSMVTKADLSEMVGELQTAREEQTVIAHQNKRTNERADRHEKRITVIERKIGIVTASHA